MTWEQVILRLRQHPDVRLGAGTTEKAIAAAEGVLGVRFPNSFRQYLLSIGWCDMGSDELYGLGDDLPSPYRDVVRSTQAERELIGLPKSFVVVCRNGWGNLICLQTDEVEKGECPLVFVRLCPKADMRTIASSFSEFVAACLAYGLDDLTEPLFEWGENESPTVEHIEPISWQEHRQIHQGEALWLFDTFRVSRRWLREWHTQAKGVPWVFDRHLLEQEARSFLLRHSWCLSVRSLTIHRYIEGIFGLFLAEIDPAPHSSADQSVWVIVGDLPPAYIDVPSAPTPAEAIEAYLAAMEEWVAAVQQGMTTEDVIPVYYRFSQVPVPPVLSFAELLKRRLRLLKKIKREWETKPDSV